MARSRRYEFTKATMRAALARSAGRCEAMGVAYGLQPGQRCNAVLVRKEYDHYPLPATMEGSDVVDNCIVCCPTCHGHKTRTLDIPVQAKTKRVSDKANNIRPAPKLSSQGFQRSPRQRRATTRIQPKFDGDILARRNT